MPRYSPEELQAMESESFESQFPYENEEERVARERDEWRAKIAIFGAGLERKAEETEALRKPIEDRWIDDIRQYKGLYRESEQAKINRSKGSDRFVNITRRKTIAGEAKFSDMILPNDDRNWSIQPTPVVDETELGELQEEVQRRNQPAMPQAPTAMEGMDPGQQGLMAAAAGAMQQPGQQAPAEGQQGMPPPGVEQMAAGAMQQPGQEPGAKGGQQKKVTVDDIVKERCSSMQDEIDDQLTEAKHEAVCRDVIHHGFLVGTGVVKGPEIRTKSRRRWRKEVDPETGESVRVIEFQEITKPTDSAVAPWDFFPDMTATKLEDCEFIFERHWMTKKDLRRLAKTPGFIKEGVIEALRSEPTRIAPDYLNQLREMSGLQSISEEKRYVVWEYHGPVEKEYLLLCGVDVDEDDPLEEYEGVVWVCGGVVLKAMVNPLDTHDRPYSVFNLEKDEASIFGYGIPYLMRNPQEIVNSVWRMLLDNAGLSVGGQVIINDQIIEPVAVNGKLEWDLTPLKLWRLKDKKARPSDAFQVFEFPNHQNELGNIFQLARQLADEESFIPLVAEGESAQHQTQTASGLEMLLNSHAIIMRRAVKNWDDDITVPLIGRFYDFNMQFNEREEIKGDYVVEARGSSSLLLKETQARNILNLANFAQSPLLQMWFKFKAIADKLANTMQMDADEFVKTEEEYGAEIQAMQAQQQGDGGAMAAQVEQSKLQLQYQIHQEKINEAKEDRAFRQWEREQTLYIEAMKLAKDKEIKLTELQAMLENTALKGKIDRSKIADEARIKVEFGSGI